MEVYPFEIVDYLLHHSSDNQENKDGFYDQDIKFRILDCRRHKDAGMLPFSIYMSYKNPKSDEWFQKTLQTICENEEDTHFCIMTSSEKTKEETAYVERLINNLRKRDKKYVSVIPGGFDVIFYQKYIDFLGNTKGN